MEVFVHGLPRQAPDGEVRRFFGDVLRSYGAPIIKCTRLTNKSCANILIPNVGAANAFLAAHGSDPKSRKAFRPNTLSLNGQLVHCKPGKDSPDPFEIRRLLKNGSPAQKENIPAKQNDKKQGPVPFTQLATGIWDYESGNLIFHPCYYDARTGSATIGGKVLLIKLNGNDVQPVNAHVIINLWSLISIASDIGSLPTVTFTMSEAPKIYSRHMSTQEELLDKLLSLSISGRIRKEESQYDRICYLSKSHQPLSGICFVYRITLATVKDLIAIESRLRASHSAPGSIRCRAPASRTIRNVKAEFDLLDRGLADSGTTAIPFCVKFQCQRLALNGYLSPGMVLKLVPHVKQLIEDFGDIAVADAIKTTSRSIPYAGPYTDYAKLACSALVDTIRSKARTFIYRGSAYHKAKTSQHMGLVHKVWITPMCTRLEGPDLEHMNRVLRNHSEHIDYFIRATFCDENGDELKYEYNVSRTPVYQKYKNVLLGEKASDSVRICGRLFAYIGYSHSSLRTQQCWLMAPFYEDRLIYPKDVIKSMGDFEHIQVPARCAARIGQCFSDATETIVLEPGTAEPMWDIERNGRCFTDGIGTISYDQLRLIWKKFSKAKKRHATSIQIRYQGAKGMLVLDRSIQGKVTRFRKSMMKFPGSRDDTLEVLGASYRPLPMYLNRQYIAILDRLGTRSEAFLALQQKALQSLQAMMESPIKAAKYLESTHYGTACRLPFLIRCLHYIGLDYRDDRFLQQAVEATTRVELRDLKHRSRIPVENAHTLFGIVDETGDLLEGQIYVITKNNEGEVIQHTGRALVTRSPALHPGDFQFADALAIPSGSMNEHLHNNVIFSQHGQRDFQSQLSGGDLDGDLYNVIFDKSLFPMYTAEPADYPRVVAQGLGRTVTAADMADFFIKFMMEDKLGYICNTHLIIADQKVEGVCSPECLKLASMASVAVDFSKTGISTDMSDFPPKTSYNSRIRPDFMAPVPRLILESNMRIRTIDDMDEDPEPDAVAIELDSRPSRYRYYQSSNALGLLYRAIDETKFLESLDSRVQPVRPYASPTRSLLQRLWLYIKSQTMGFQWEEHRDFARQVRERYDAELVNSMYDYSPHPTHSLTEIEVVLGIVLGKDGTLMSKRAREKNIDLREQNGQYVREIVQWIRLGPDDWEGTVGDEGTVDGKDEYEEYPETVLDGVDGTGPMLNGALERSIACFAVAVEEDGFHYPNGIGKLNSFAYLAAAVCLEETRKLPGSRLKNLR